MSEFFIVGVLAVSAIHSSNSRSVVDSILSTLSKVVGFLHLVRPDALRDANHPQKLMSQSFTLYGRRVREPC